MDITLHFAAETINGEVNLPLSKSISNRLLILQALAGKNINSLVRLSDSEDTCRMMELLFSTDTFFDAGDAGTVMRFMTAYLSLQPGCWTISGTERMKERPVGELVNALRKTGAEINYLEAEGFPPLRIRGRKLTGGKISLNASVSSQFVSALMMIAPYMEQGLEIQLTGSKVSFPYICMTAQMMKEFGVEVEIRDNNICVSPGAYFPIPYQVEADWSSASYFYELLAVAGKGTLLLKGLKKNSIQGDIRQVDVWKKLGVHTRFIPEGAELTAFSDCTDTLEYDFTDMPDIVQACTVACCLKNVPFVFSGVQTLRIKETDRLYALKNELGRLGYSIETEDNVLVWSGDVFSEKERAIYTYGDHRMAMAFAPAVLKFPDLIIKGKDVVRKSFPDFWQEFLKIATS